MKITKTKLRIETKRELRLFLIGLKVDLVIIEIAKVSANCIKVIVSANEILEIV